ncbi:PRC-barrel domain-containing protein [Reyranella sp.]|uniref:PRC-barrel domain-containing protein n=1 Tax=Reyranella sp. TaxID=1929291 RepID=UPI002731DD07|nr:PRC-barrel domain-containing protein [Reyranella sp.]MDP2375800.1 PRC-barrel domain-containing protein [Reyranella sp.]
MLKHIVLAAFITSGSVAAYAQAPQQAASPPAATTAMPAPAASADTRKLIGRNIQNAQNETIGEIKSIHVGTDGKIEAVMVGVGGFLGVGEREVRLAWTDLTVTNNGEKVTVNMTKDQLKAKPEYKYSDQAYRGQVFTDTGPWKAADATRAPTETRPGDTKPADTNVAATASTGDFNADGHMSANALIGTNVRNEARETVGEIEDVYLDTNGAVKVVVVSVGGFLGMGTKNVAVKWSDIKFTRDGNSALLLTTWTKDALKAMPDYKYERRAPVTRSGG